MGFHPFASHVVAAEHQVIDMSVGCKVGTRFLALVCWLFQHVAQGLLDQQAVAVESRRSKLVFAPNDGFLNLGMKAGQVGRDEGFGMGRATPGSLLFDYTVHENIEVIGG